MSLMKKVKRPSSKFPIAFLATLAHELRTPLTSIILQAQLIRRGTIDPQRLEKASLAIENAANIQTQLIEDLVDFSRISTGKLKVESTPVNLEEVITSAIKKVDALAKNKSITIISDLTKISKQVFGDAARLQQVICNLLGNAIKFTSRSGKIKVSLKATKTHAQIQVSDKGIGITAELLPQIFNRLKHEEDKIARTHAGLGLGLALVQHFVKMHKGTIKAESPGENKGSTFTILLPFINKVKNEKK